MDEGEILGMVADPFGQQEQQAVAPYEGIVIGKTNLPLVNEGEALFHVAQVKQVDSAEEKIEEFQQRLDEKPGTEPPIN